MFLNFSKPFREQAARALGFCLFVAGSFFASQIIIIFLAQLLIQLRLMQPAVLEKPLFQLVLIAAVYCLTLGVVIMLPRLCNPARKLDTKKELAIAKKPRISDFGLSLLGFGAYFILTIVLTLIIQAVWQGFNADQAQQVGFKSLGSQFEYIAAFIALVIIPPVVEELLFRGYLFGKLRATLSLWPSILITSLLFGAIHLQWNVGVDVFALSLVLCYVREKTDAVWAGIGLHMLKNTIAFVLLFLHPEIVKNLL